MTIWMQIDLQLFSSVLSVIWSFFLQPNWVIELFTKDVLITANFARVLRMFVFVLCILSDAFAFRFSYPALL